MTPARVDETQLGPVLDFMRLLWSVDHSLQSVSKRMEGTLGVTGPQRVVIRMVGQFPSISAGDVAALLHIHPSTLTGVLKRLVARRILERSTDPQDGRRARFVLSAEGQRLNRSKAGTVEAAVQRTLDRVPAATVGAARELFSVLAQDLDLLLAES